MIAGFMIRSGIGLALLSLILLVAVRLLAWDGVFLGDMRQTLSAPDDCAQPCFMGIQPGGDLRVVMQALDSHPWVESYNVIDRQMEVTGIDWAWSGDQPDFLGAMGQVKMWHTRADWVTLRPQISLAEWWLAFGPPESAVIERSQGILIYPGFFLRLQPDCRSLWDQQPAMHVAHWLGESEAFDWTQMQRTHCP